MKKYFFVFVLLHVSLSLFAQDVTLCEDTYRLAEEAFNKKNYKKALTYYNQVMSECGEGYSNCKSRAITCKTEINKLQHKNAFSVRVSTPECDGGGEIIYLKVPGKKGLKAESKVDWIRIDECVNDTIWLSVDKNMTPYQRSGEVEIYTSKGQKNICQIKQSEGEATINTSKELVAFSSIGGKREFLVESNAQWGIEPLDVDWVSVSKHNNKTIRVTCKTNRTIQQRETWLTLYTLAGNAKKSVRLVQELGDTYLEIEDEQINVSNNSVLKELQVESNNTWNITYDVSWLSAKKREGKIELYIHQNIFAEDREAEISISTGDNKIERNIRVFQSGAKPYMTLDDNDIHGSGNSASYSVTVNTNVPNWRVSSNSTWCRVQKIDDSRISISVTRNDNSYSRSDQIYVTGGGLKQVIDVYQPNRGYIGRYNDYFDANGDWRLTWFSTDVHIMTAIGINISTINARWKPVEVSLLNLNLNYDFIIRDEMDVAWEPVVRGFLPVTRDGMWAAFVGMGAHVGMNYSAFLLEFGMECHWSEKYSSRMFFKYNGTCAIGMSFDIGAWIW